jgi:hypothetical protein
VPIAPRSVRRRRRTAGGPDEWPLRVGRDAEGRGDQLDADAVAAAVASTPWTRRKRPVVSTKTTGRKLHLPDDVHDRLWLLARQRRTTVSTVAAEILDRNLPRFMVEREG